MNLIERRKRKLIIFTVLCILVFALFIGVLVRNGKVAAATCPECTSHPTLSAATCEKPATCPQCGYQTGSALGHKFVRFNVGSGDGCVVQMGCQRCGCINQVNFGNHKWAYGSYFNNGTKCMVKMRCQRCGIIRTLSREHTYVTKYDETNHWEECSKCKGIKTNSKEEHKGIKWIDEGNETHSGTCSICKFKLKEEHSYANGKCTKCGAKESSENETCEHNYVEKHDETYHWEECLKCNALKKETLQTHKYQEYTDNKNGTHTTTCTICGYKLTEEHLEECEKCNKQANTGNNGNKEDDNTGNNDDNKGNNNIDKNDSKDEDNTNNDKKDNTAIDKNLPYTGTSKIITLVIIILSALITLTVFKLKKYKGIK